MKKKLLAIILAVVMMFSSATPAFAADISAESFFTKVAVKVIDALMTGLTGMLNSVVKDGETFEGPVANCTTEGATGKIEYKSSDEAIAKVDAKTGAITLGAKYGTAVITARFDATGSFANSEASYSIKHVGDFVFYESFDKCDGKGNGTIDTA